MKNMKKKNRICDGEQFHSLKPACYYCSVDKDPFSSIVPIPDDFSMLIGYSLVKNRPEITV